MKNKYIKIIIFSLIAIVSAVFLVSVIPVQAQSANSMLWGGYEGNFQGTSGLGNTDPRIMIANIIRIALGFLGVIAVILLMYGGWLWMTSSGDAARLDKAKKTLISAIIGLVIVLMAFSLASFIINNLYSATGGGACDPAVDPPRVCGCEGGGTQICQADGSWGACVGGTCAIGDMCCPGIGCLAPAVCNSIIPPVNCDSVPGGGCSSPDDTICDAAFGVGTYFCALATDPLPCTCQPLGTYGAPCDSDTLTAVCDADSGMCVSDLRCDDVAGSPTECTCVGAPVIDWVSPLDGARGNLITIGGRYFGTTTGEVYFNGVLAPFPNTVNANCTDFWTDRQVVVVIPAGAPLGANTIRLVRLPTGDEDTTQNTRGPIINFDVNTTVRPGLCQLSAATGRFTDTITYYGINLSGSTAYFGNYTNNLTALNSNFPVVDQGTADVPDIRPGNTTTFASTTGQGSNFLNFQVLPEILTGPYITSFDPVSGPPGQYVTIYGGGFGNTRGTSRVLFGATEADYSFPDVCADSVWTDNQVIVKVPAGASGNQTIFMEIGAWPPVDTTALSPNAFNATVGAPSPSLCRIYPSIGPNNSPIGLWGEYFGAASDIVRFHLNNDQAVHTSWTDNVNPNADEIITTVEPLAVTGPVSVVVGGNSGNSMNFTVGLCTSAPDPDAACGGVCCPLGSFKEGRCAVDDPAQGGNNSGSITIDDCFSTIPSSVYEWDFTTISSLTTLPCDANVGAPGCQADHALCIANGFDYCDPAAGCMCASGVPSCDQDNDPATGCQPDDIFCAGIPGYDICDPAAGCVCASLNSESCSGYNLNQCMLADFCPNSPGQCSTNAGGNLINTAACDLDCDNLSAANSFRISRVGRLAKFSGKPETVAGAILLRLRRSSHSTAGTFAIPGSVVDNIVSACTRTFKRNTTISCVLPDLAAAFAIRCI